MGDLNRERLIQLLGMLGSYEQGERANAASFADRMVCDAGLTWREVLEGSDTDAVRALNREIERNNREIERYRQDVIRLEGVLEASHRQVRNLTIELEHTRAFVKNERSTWNTQRETVQEERSSTAPRSRPSGWGSDLFGDEPALKPVKKSTDKEPTKKPYSVAIRVIFWAVIIIAGIIFLVQKRT